MEEVQSVRGKGWVKFEEEGGPGTPPAPQDVEPPLNNEAPGSLEVNTSVGSVTIGQNDVRNREPEVEIVMNETRKGSQYAMIHSWHHKDSMSLYYTYTSRHKRSC